ncbi:MAG: hypothetical protein KC776_22120 [Myxococcales bacterium]|nr:hypothetical protein [Myxococcales bacterium]MCB9575666.1 hypothetical protein [Polyangiaceae bacterium]
MRKVTLGFAFLFVAACGPSYGGQGVKTPEEIVAEQEQMGAEQEAQEKDYQGSAEETDLEKKAKFDKKQTELELKRAERSGETCPGVVTEEGPTGTAHVTLLFANDGHVKDASIAAPFEGTQVGNCVLNAMKAVIVPRFTGPEETVEWEVHVEAKADDSADDKKKK